MAQTVAQVVARIRKLIGDDTSFHWTNDQMKEALKDAVQDGWPNFFEHVVDDTSYTGPANALAINTREIAVPTAFLADNATERGAGEIFSIWCRMGDGTADPLPRLFKLRKSISRIDPLAGQTPKIRFWQNTSRQCELIIFGGRPFTGSLNDGDTLLGVDTVNGYLTYLRHKTQEYLHRSRIKGSGYDRENRLAQAQLAMQEADKAKRLHRMPRDNYTLFNFYGPS